MKKLLSLLALCAMTMVSCESLFGDDEPKKPVDPVDTPKEPEEPEQPEIEFQLTSENVVEITAQGGEFVITYAITNPDETLAVEVATEAKWIALSDALDATPYEVHLFVEANQSVEPRSAEVEVSYGEFKANVIVNQAADEELLPYLSGIYFGDMDCGDGCYNYNVVLATAENVLDVVTGDYYIAEGNKYLFLDIFASEPSANYNAQFAVPEGTYTFDVENTAMAGTVGAEYSYFYDATAEGEQVNFTEGVVVVSKEYIEATFKSAEGKEYHYYTVTTSVDNRPLFKGNGKSGVFSTLEDNLVMEFESPSLYAECYYDYYVIGKDMWILYIDDYATSQGLVMELLVPMGEAPVGKFPVCSDLTKERMALPGFVDGYGDAWWSWLFIYDGYAVVGEAPVVSGDLEIVDDGVGTYTATFSFVDDKGFTISGSCTSYFEVYGDVSVLSAHRRVVRPSRK